MAIFQVILYVHGGGFICTNIEFYDMSVTYLARQGYTVVGCDYPLAPLSRHPEPIFSILKAIHYIQATKEPDTRYHLLGDSAGANIAMQVAALLSNHDLLRDFLATMRGGEALWEGGSGSRIPRVHSVASIYGMMGEEATYEPGPWNFNNTVRDPVCELLWRTCSAKSTGVKIHAFPSRFTDWLPLYPELAFPPALLTCGDADPVLPSSVYLSKVKIRAWVRVRVRVMSEVGVEAVTIFLSQEMKRRGMRHKLTVYKGHVLTLDT